MTKNMHWHVYMLLLIVVVWPATGLPSKHIDQTNIANENAETRVEYIPRESFEQQKQQQNQQQQQHPNSDIKPTMGNEAIKQSTFVYEANLPQDSQTQVENLTRDGESSKKIIGSSVVTSVSVILEGDEPQIIDALGKKVPKPPPSLQVASPINLLNPDRYEFYTFDDNGNLVKRLMTLQEIQSIVANGDGEGPSFIHQATIDDGEPEKNVQDIVYSVQSVLNKQAENKPNNQTAELPVLDTPDVSSTWSMILPAIFGNTGGEIYPQQKLQQIVMTPDTEVVDMSTKATTTHTTKKSKPSKRKPGQKRKPATTTTTETTPQVVQEELEPHESVYTGMNQYQNIANNVKDFQAFSNIHLQPIYHKKPENTTKHAFVNNQEIKQNISTSSMKQNLPKIPEGISITQTVSKKPINVQQQKPSTPTRKNSTKRPRPTSSYVKGQKKPAPSQISDNQTTNKRKPTKPTKPMTTTALPSTSTTTEATTTTPAPVTNSPEIVMSTTKITTTVQKKKRKKPTRQPNPIADTVTNTKPTHVTEKRKHATTQKPTQAQTVNTDTMPIATETQENLHKTHHRQRPKPNRQTITTTPTTMPEISTESVLVSEIFPDLDNLQHKKLTSTTSRPAFVSFGYPVPAYNKNEDATVTEDVEQITVSQSNNPTLPALTLMQDNYQPTTLNAAQTEDDLKLSFGQIVQSLKQDATEETLKPIGYDSAESLEKLEEMANRRKKPIITQLSTTPAATILISTTDADNINAETTTDTYEQTSQTQTQNAANVLKFEPLIADVVEPTVKDIPTTTMLPTDNDNIVEEHTVEYAASTFDEEVALDSTTTEIPNENTNVNRYEESDATKGLSVAQQIDMLLANNKEEQTTLAATQLLDLNSNLSMETLSPHNAIPMSNFQNHAATIASHLIDGVKMTEANTEIDKLMSDVMQQISDETANEPYNQVTNAPDFNTTPSVVTIVENESKIVPSYATEQDITQMLTSALKETLDSDNILTTTEAEELLTSTVLPIDDENLSMQKHDFPTDIKHESSIEYSPTTSIITTKNAETIAQHEVSTNSSSFIMSANSSTEDALEVNVKQNIPMDEITNKENAQKSDNVPVKLNKSEPNTAELLSSVVQDLKVYKANDEDMPMAYNNTTIKNAVDAVEDVVHSIIDSDLTKIKVNDASSIEQHTDTKLQDNVAGATQHDDPQYEFVTEASVVHEKQTVMSQLDTPNPINSTTQSTENVQIFSAINNSSEEIMLLNANSTEMPIDTTMLYSTDAVADTEEETTTSNENETEIEIETETQTEPEPEVEMDMEMETETTETDEDVEKSTTYATETTESLESTTLLLNEQIDANITAENMFTIETTTDSPINEDPYVKLGETTVMPVIALDSANLSKNVFDNITQSETIIIKNASVASLQLETTTNSMEEVAITITSSTTNSPQITTTKRLNTLKPVSYFKPPSFNGFNQPQYPKPMTYVSSQHSPLQRPAALSNLMATSTQATRPPVRLEASPTHSKGLEASTMSLDADVLDFARLCNELAFSYWKSITSEKISSARSLVISPFALTSMLSMVFLGARGITSGEMNEVLKLDDMVTFNPHLIFKNITDSVEKNTDSDISTAAFVREIYSDRANGRVLQFFKEKTQQFYSGHVEEVNFNVVNDIIRRRTNLLVKRHTLGKVQEYLRTNSVWVHGPLATISANLFQTDCSRASKTSRDGELYFQVQPTLRERRLVPIPAILYKSGFTAGYDAHLDATVVAFGRIQDTVSTIYLMPGHQSTMSPAESLERLEKQLIEIAFKENAWSNLLTTLMDRPGLEVQLPRFSHRSFVNASLGLQKMGLKGLFQSDFADLRGLTGSSNRDVFISDMIQINTFSTCGEDRIADQHHVEMYPAPPLRKRNKEVDTNVDDDDDILDSSEAIIDFGSLVQESALARSFYDDLLDPKYLELPLPLRPRQARVPDAPPRLRFDKPFLYFVRHNPTGIILFMGRFNPRLLP